MSSSDFVLIGNFKKLFFAIMNGFCCQYHWINYLDLCPDRNPVFQPWNQKMELHQTDLWKELQKKKKQWLCWTCHWKRNRSKRIIIDQKLCSHHLRDNLQGMQLLSLCISFFNEKFRPIFFNKFFRIWRSNRNSFRIINNRSETLLTPPVEQLSGYSI